MPRFSSIVGLLAFFPLTLSAAEGSRVPVLLELFTSEGCSSCPPADRLLQVFDQQQPVPGADLIVLSEHVDYWNRLGWKDPFSSAQFSERQQLYTEKYGLDGVYTPQLVIDGHYGVVGGQQREAAAAIQKAARERKVAITIASVAHNGDHVAARIEVAAWDGKVGRGDAVLYVAIAENRAESQVARGENSGRTLAHVAVTRILQQVGAVDLGNASSKDISISAPQGAGASGWRLVTFVQDKKSGHILGAAARKI